MGIEINIFLRVVLAYLLVTVSNSEIKAQDDQSFRLKSKPVGVLYQKNRSQKGSELLFDKWCNGEIILSNGQKIENIDLNFNAYSNDLLYAIKGNTAVVVSKIQYKGFKVHSDHKNRYFALVTDSIFHFTNHQPIILEVLFDNQIKAYADRKYKVNYTLMKNNPFGQSVYYSEDSYYVIIDGELIGNPQNIRSYYKFYDKVIIKQLVRSNKFNLKNEDELISFLSFLDKKNKL